MCIFLKLDLHTSNVIKNVTKIPETTTNKTSLWWSFTSKRRKSVLLTFFLGNIRKVSFFMFGSKLKNFFSITCLNTSLPNNHNSYDTITGSSECLPCPAGFDCSTYNSAVPCAAGYYSEQGEKSCTQCDTGTVPNLAQDSCDPCPAGYSCGDPA